MISSLAPLKRRTPLRPGQPPRRSKRIRQRRATPRRSSRIRDEAYLAFVRALPCCVDDAHHAGRIDPHHAGLRPAGRKADDDTCIPLCRYHHDLWDAPMWSSGRNPFQGWTREQRRAWQDSMVERYHQLWERSRSESYDQIAF